VYLRKAFRYPKDVKVDFDLFNVIQKRIAVGAVDFIFVLMGWPGPGGMAHFRVIEADLPGGVLFGE
jgi:hypothetical protein